jgi:hypothetical protein
MRRPDRPVSSGVVPERRNRVTYELAPAALVPRDQIWFHHPEMQRRIHMAETDLAEGRTKVTHSADEAQALLDTLKRKRRRERR